MQSAIGEVNAHLLHTNTGARCDDPHLGRGLTIGAMLYVDLGRLISLSRAAEAAPPPRMIDGALVVRSTRQKVTPSFLRRSLVLENHRATKILRGLLFLS